MVQQFALATGLGLSGTPVSFPLLTLEGMPRLVPTGRGPEVVEIGPQECANGHSLRPPNVQVFSFPCSCSGPAGHRGWRCWTCGEIHYEPPHIATRGRAAPMASAM